MKIFLKILTVLVGLVAVTIVGGIIYINYAFPKVGIAPNLTASNDSAFIARGEYLVNNVTACWDCHSENDHAKFAGKVIPGTEGKGGNVYPEQAGFPGTFYSPNLTSYHLENWTDGEIALAITAGVSKDGEPLFPLMPYKSYRYLANEDLKAIISYLRTIKPIKNDVARSEASFPFSLIMRTIPAEASPMELPDRSNSVKSGEYLTHIGGCISCHTPLDDQNAPIAGMTLAGGQEFDLPTGGIVRSVNITPDEETGIGNWDKDAFINRFKYYENNDSIFVKKDDFNSLMPWYVYAGMNEEDLGAIYDYLMVQKPVKNAIERFTP